MPPNRFESEVESFLEGSHGDRTHIKRADHHTVTPLCGTLLPPPAGTAAGLGAGITISHAIPSRVFHGLKSDCWNSADSNVLWGCAVVELHAELREFPFPWLSLLLRGIALLG